MTEVGRQLAMLLDPKASVWLRERLQRPSRMGRAKLNLREGAIYGQG